MAAVATGLLIGGALASAKSASAAPPPAPAAPAQPSTTIVYASPPPAPPPQPSQFSAPAYTPPPPVASQPCPNAAVATVNGVAYSKCGTNWYTQAYGANGPTFVPVATPPGF